MLERGFTLIELLIVIGIVGALVSAVMIVLNPLTQIQKANDARRKSDLEQIQRALEVFYNDIGRYPSATNSKITDLSGSEVDWGDPWTPYMSKLPEDPSSPTNTYVYDSSSGEQSYRLYASLERADDPQSCGGVCPNAGTLNCGGDCNYGVTSPNVSP
ncbi:MAG: type II secretion system protein GspG [Candidatus Levybacteria bacterium]|nr:type II secretion system protein GspG [Candidatus Levybacteria bacterium]